MSHSDWRRLRRKRGATLAAAVVALAAILLVFNTRTRADEPPSQSVSSVASAKDDPARKALESKKTDSPTAIGVNRPADVEPPSSGLLRGAPLDRPELMRTMQNVVLFGLVSLAPIGLLMVTAFVRINIVLILLRQALGSPQVPGNQILTALALLLTGLVMRPHAEEVYQKAIEPFAAGRISAASAWDAGTRPIKTFMVQQIVWTKHQDYLQALYEYTVPASPGRVDSNPERHWTIRCAWWRRRTCSASSRRRSSWAFTCICRFW